MANWFGYSLLGSFDLGFGTTIDDGSLAGLFFSRRRSFAPAMRSDPRSSWFRPLRTRERAPWGTVEFTGLLDATVEAQSDTTRDLRERLKRVKRQANAPAGFASTTAGEAMEFLATPELAANAENLRNISPAPNSTPEIPKGWVYLGKGVGPLASA